MVNIVVLQQFQKYFNSNTRLKPLCSFTSHIVIVTFRPNHITGFAVYSQNYLYSYFMQFSFKFHNIIPIKTSPMANPQGLIDLQLQQSHFHSNNGIPFYATNYQNPNTQIDQIPNCGHYHETSQKWNNNVLVANSNNNSRAPFALKHLTSFEENSFDGLGNRLSQSLSMYIKGATNLKNISIFTQNHPRLSRMKWEEDVQQLITSNEKLNFSEKETLVFSGRTNFQAELLISEIIQFIHPHCLTFCFSLAAFLIKHYQSSGVQGLQEEQILLYVQQNHKQLASRVYPRLAELQFSGYHERESQTYENFIKVWMGIFFLCLNGFLENSHELKNYSNF